MQKNTCKHPQVNDSIDFVIKSELSSVVELYLAKVDVEGSNPLARSIFFVFIYGGVAQLVEQVTLNHWVQGSNPCAPTMTKRIARQFRRDSSKMCAWCGVRSADVPVG